jgi:N-acetylgalactosamine-N,N'-diacetylbacillosaminyl-diphospho-undecaprenol 4-alpha-N-acetylgalactosaminyltransferase
MQAGPQKLAILVTSMALGGAEKVAVTLAREFRQRGVDVLLVCLEKNDFYRDDADVIYLSDHTGSGEGPLKKLLSLPLFAWRLKQLLKRQAISVVQSHINRSNYVNVLAQRFGSPHRAQLVNHGITSSLYRQDNFLGRVNRALVRWLYPRAEQVLCPSEGMRRDLLDYGVPGERMQVIANPFSIERIAGLARQEITPGDFRFRAARRYLLAAGRLDPVKRFTDLLPALAQVREQHPDVELIILGEGPERQAIRDLADADDLHDVVHLLGRVDNPYQYIARAELLLSASASEGFGNVIVEALACGTPVIATDCVSGPREILAPQSAGRQSGHAGEPEFVEYGVLVPVGGVETMAEAIRVLLEDDALRASYAEDGKRRARDFDVSVIADAYLDALGEFLGKGS